MSKSSTASAQKNSTQLPQKSAWAKGPPQNASTASSPRSQSPAPSSATPPVNATHSRRPSTLGQGVPVKDGVSVPRSNVGSVKHGSSPVTFGSIDDASAPISSSPAAAPVIKPSDGLKSFGSVPATTSGHVNGKSSISSKHSSTPPSETTTSTPAKPLKMDVRKFFQNPGSSSSAPPSHPSSDTASPSTRPSSLPPHHHHHQQQSSSSSSSSQPPPPQSQPSQMGGHAYPYGPGGGVMRPQQNSGGAGQPPRSPVYPRQMPNGSGGPRPPPGGPNGPGGPPQMPAGLSSPRLGTHPHPGQPAGMPPPPQPVPVPGWPGYYYPDPYMTPQYPAGWYPNQQPLTYQPPHHHQHHPPPQGPPGPPHAVMPMSPRNPQPPLQGPGTPTQQHAVPHPIHSPHPTPSHSHTHSSSNSVGGLSSPPPTPSTTQAHLNTNASAFVPGRAGKPLTIKNADGIELSIEALKKTQHSSSHHPQQPASPAPVPPSGFNSPGNRRSVIRMESEEDRKKRLAGEEEKERAKEKAKKDAEEKVKREAEEKARKEEAARRKEEEEKERLRKEEEEKERIRLEEEQKQERLRKEEEEKERIRQEEEERKLKAEEEERIRKEQAEEEEARRKEEAERLRLEEEAKATTAAEAEVESPTQESEEGEVEEKDDELLPDKPTPNSEEAKDRVKEKENLRINTNATPPTDIPRRRPGPLDLSYAKDKGPISAPLPSALATARHIDDLGSVIYPEGVKSPKTELNVGAKDGKFRYDRDFLLQFMSICKEKPDMLPPLDAIGLEPSDQSSFSMSRGGSGRHRQSSGAMAPPAIARQNSIGLGIMPGGSAGKPNFSNPFSMGNFATPGSKMSSEERFAMANNSRVASVSGASLQYARPSPPMVRSASQGGPGGTPMGSNRTRSKRGEKRNDSNKVGGGQHGHGSTFGSSGFPSVGPNGQPLEPVVPLKPSENRWVPASTTRKPQAPDPDSPEIVDRKVKGLLNKLTMEKFDSISDQIIAWANRSEKEKDGRTLIQVIRLVFEKATDEAAWSEMYARLCRKMMEQISPKVQDDGIKNPEGKPIAGGQLFRKYLLNRCQEDFERGWVAKEATAAAALTKATDDEAAKAANEKNKDGEGETELYSVEYYAAQKAKRQGLGLIKFIGELFKLQMLTERIMHECVKKLLGNVENPEEEEIESLCKLLSTVGSILDTNKKAGAHMDVYFSRMKELTKSGSVSSRMQFMLQDVIELRDRKWVTRNLVAAPSTIAQIHEVAAKEKAMADKESYQRQMSMSRGGSRRGNDRGGGGDFSQVGPDGWAVAGGAGPPRPPPKAGDLSNFGKINKAAAPMTFGPSSVFAGKKDGKGREPLSRTSSSSNMFHMLSQNTEPAADAASSSKGAAPEPPAQRRKLQLLPRSKPSADEAAPTASENPSEDEDAGEAMSEADAKKKIDEDSKEFFGVRNLEEAEVYFINLPAEHRFRLVDKLVTSAIESKESDARLVGDLFALAASKDLCSPSAFEEGFMPTAEILDDIAIDAPKAFDLMAIMLKGAGLDKDEERRTRIAGKSMDSDKLVGLLS